MYKWMLRVLVSLLLSAAPSFAADLIQLSDIQYLGAFRVPPQLEYGGIALGYNPGSPGTLFATCLDQSPLAAEISIPTAINGAVGSLNTATLIQGCADPTAGGTVGVGSGSTKIGGMLVSGGKLYISEYIFYDAEGTQTAWLYVKPNLNLSQSNAAGAYTVTSAGGGAGYLDGWMAPIPSAWQTALHGTVASGNNSLSIITRTSWGPGAFSWDPAQLTSVGTPIPSTPLHYYTSANPTLGIWDGAAPNDTTRWWNNTGTGYRSGGIIPDVGRSILFFGAQGRGPFCYGDGQLDCGDPVDSTKGVHGYPYQFQIMAFDLDDLAAVAAGSQQPHSVLPYAVWPLTTIVGADGTGDNNAGGAVYDPTLKRIYFSTPFTDGLLPLIQVWQLNVSALPTLNAPTTLSVTTP